MFPCHRLISVYAHEQDHMKAILPTLACLSLLGIGALAADTLRESYVAVLSERDHFNSRGERLTNAAAIIRQDRANFHTLKNRDPGDEADRFFAAANNREALEQLLKRGTSNAAALLAIVNGTPTIVVSIYQSDSGRDYVNVTVKGVAAPIQGNAVAADTLQESYVAVLSERDHFSSKGERLTNAAAIIRQDRANFHTLGKRDAGDQSDRFFADANNREALEQLLKRGSSNPAILRTIVNGTPTVIVKIFRAANGGSYVNVLVSQ